MKKTGLLWPLGAALIFLVVALVVFRALCAPDAILMTTDDNFGHIVLYKRTIDVSFCRPWMGEQLWGMSMLNMLRPGFAALSLLPIRIYMNWNHAFCLAAGAFFLTLYLRDKGLKASACIFGGLVAYWVGTNLTLTYAGHIGKYGIIMFFGLALFAFGRWGKTKKMAWGGLGAAAAGCMFLEQVDVALFCALLLLPIAIYELWHVTETWNPIRWIPHIWLPFLAIVLIIGGAVLSTFSSGLTEVPSADDPQGKWNYITQWSQPPEESLDFIAPGWTGWQTTDPKGPYWGRLGRDANWDKTRQGFMNFKLENVYVGSLPLLFALIALMEAWKFRRQKPETARLIFLWGAVCALALCLSFGKNTPLYKIIYYLPGFGNIRNPNKFIHVFQIAWGVLAAFGLHLILEAEQKTIKKWLGLAIGFAGVVGIMAFFHVSSMAHLAKRLSMSGWNAASANAIVSNKIFALSYSAGAFAVAAILLFGILKRKDWRTYLAWIPAVVVAIDAAVILAPRYIQTMSNSYIAENDVTRHLKTELEWNRCALVRQDDFYNLWLTYLFPYHDIQTINVTQLPRVPADYEKFFNTVGRDPFRMWQLTGVSHILAPAEFRQALRQNPWLNSMLEETFSYSVRQSRDGDLSVIPATAAQPAEHIILKFKDRPARIAAVTAWEQASDDQALQALMRPDFLPLSKVFLPDTLESVPPKNNDVHPVESNIQISRAAPGRYEFTVSGNQPIIARIAERYTSDWKATMDGKSVPLLRCDFMFQGVAVPPGQHDIVVHYAPRAFPIYLQGIGLFVGLLAVLALLIPAKKNNVIQNSVEAA